MIEYQIFLCQDFWSEYQEKWSEKIVCEIGSSSSTFSGKAIDPVFTSRIDGTHELTFSLPRYYIDENTGEKVLNELVELISNKTKIRLKRRRLGQNEWEEYFLVVNNRKDLDANDTLYYEFQCSDAFIEELAKTGYGLTFSADYDAPENKLGLGTIHELAERILKDSGWTYRADLTENLPEYSTDLEYDAIQKRYDVVRIPQPTHPMKYIPALKRYCYKTIFNYKNKEVYCYEDSEQFTSTTTQDFLYNANKTFVDTTGWTSFLIDKEDASSAPGHIISSHKYSDNEGNSYYSMKIERQNVTSSSEAYLMNEGAALAGRHIKANTPYLLKFDLGASSAGVIKNVIITSKNPLSSEGKKNFTEKGKANLEYSRVINVTKDNEGSYFVLKSKVSISSPYIVFLVDCGSGPVYLYSAQLFEVKGKNTFVGGVDNSATNYLEVLKTLTNETILTSNSNEMGLIELPDSTTISAYTRKKVQYFVEQNDENVQYIDIDKTTIEDHSYNYLGESKKSEFDTDDRIEAELKKLSSEEKKRCYAKDAQTGILYQPYWGKENDDSTRKWELAFLELSNDKYRTLQAEKSNRFNLLQELCELFSVWPVFKMKDDNGNIIREMWFKEQHINTNFSGFHKGVNLESLERNSDSNEVVTKIYVEDQENEFANDGFVTIRTASQNPWGENYFYNFKYYVQQELLDGELVEHDLKDILYPQVKNLNVNIREKNETIFILKQESNNLNSQIVSLNCALTAVMESINSLRADLENLQIPAPDKKKLQDNLEQYQMQEKTYKDKIAKLETNLGATNDKLKMAELEVKEWTDEKKACINRFESKYIQYIKEGVWSDSSYVDNDAYYYDAQKVANTSAVPITTWNIGVLDVNVIQDYEDFVFNIGDQTILVDNDFFGIKKDVEQNFVFEVLITAIEEHLEDNLSNRIEVRNYLTSFEDLFQRISAVTQTVELKEQIYNKADYFTKDGEIDQNILQNTLLNNSLIIANASDNSYTLDKNGLSLKSIVNPSKQSRLIAEGLFFSKSTDSTTGEPRWTAGITPDGINANLITAGQVDTSLVRIFSNGQPSFSWGELGITAYTVPKEARNTIGNIICIGDSYTFDYEYRWKLDENRNFLLDENGAKQNGIPSQQNEPENYKKYLKGWPERVAEKLLLSPGQLKDLGVGGAGFIGMSPESKYEFITQIKKLENENPNYLKGVTHIIIGGGYNDAAQNPSKTKIKQAMKECKDTISTIFQSQDNVPAVYVVAMGISAISSGKNNDLETKIYPVYKEFCKENGWYFIDIHKDWSNTETIDVTPTSGNDLPGNLYVLADGIHPRPAGSENIAELIVQKIFSTSSAVSSQESFIRLDSFGLYQIDQFDAPSFNYDSAGNAWFSGLSRNNALKKITDNATFHLTERGFGLKVSDGSSEIKLGYESSDSNDYGLFIKNIEGEPIVALKNRGASTIGGWRIGENNLSSVIDDKRGDGTYQHKFYLINGVTTDQGTVLGIGRIKKTDSNFGNAAFRISADGTLHANKATINGDGSFSGNIYATGGTIGPFTIIEQNNRNNSLIIGKALLIANTGDNWTSIVEDRIKELYPKAEIESLKLEDGTALASTNDKIDMFEHWSVGKPGSVYYHKDTNKYHIYTENTNNPLGRIWTEATETEFLSWIAEKKNTSVIYFNSVLKRLMYWNGRTVIVRDLSSDNSTEWQRDFKGREIVTVQTSFNEKDDIPVYYINNDQKFCRRQNGGSFKYYNNAASMLDDLDQGNKNIYFSQSYGGFYKNVNGEWTYLGNDNLLLNIFKDVGSEKRIKTIYHIDKQESIPEPVIMWLDNTSAKMTGYWYQDSDKEYSWVLASATEALTKTGNINFAYAIPDKESLYFYYDQNEKKWTNGGQSAIGSKPIKRLDWDPGRASTKQEETSHFSYHALTGNYYYVQSVTSGYCTIIENSLTALLNSKGANGKYYASPNGYYFYQGSRLNSDGTTSKYWTYANVNINDGGEHDMKTMFAYINSCGKQVFEYIASGKEYDCIIVGIGKYESFHLKNSTAHISKGAEYLHYVLELCCSNPTKNNLYFIADRSSSTAITEAYQSATKNRFTFIDGTGKNGYAIVSEIPFSNLERYGALYGVSQANGKYLSSGLSLLSMADKSVVLWAGYSHEKYLHPYDEYEKTKSDSTWKDNTSFWVERDGTLHAKDTYITDTEISGSLKVKTNSGTLEIAGRHMTADKDPYPALLFHDGSKTLSGQIFMNCEGDKYNLCIGTFQNNVSGTPGKSTELLSVDSDGRLTSDSIPLMGTFDGTVGDIATKARCILVPIYDKEKGNITNEWRGLFIYRDGTTDYLMYDSKPIVAI